MPLSLSVKILATFGSLISIGFGIWHFFVPKIWNWYAYIARTATELVLAVRAINVFFSLSLVLFGVANLLLVFRTTPDKFPVLVMLSVSAVLWASRVLLQLIYPQGSQSAVLQYGMLTVFILVFISFAWSAYLVWSEK